MMVSKSLANAQGEAAGLLSRLACIGVFVAPLIGWLVGNNPVPLAIAAIFFAGIGLAGQRLTPETARLAAAFGLIGQPIVLTAAFAGHPWQLDSHMVFFAVLAMLMAMADRKVLLVGAGMIALHHVSLSFALPGLLYPPASMLQNVERALLHGLVVVLETAVLYHAVTQWLRMDADNERAKLDLLGETRRAETALEDAQLAKAQVEEALRSAEASRSDAEKSRVAAEDALAHAETETKRAQEMDRLARETEEKERAHREAIAARQATVVDGLRSALSKLARRNLDARIESAFDPEYEGLREDYNAAVEALRHALSLVTENAMRMQGEIRQIASAAEDLSQRTDSQASSLEEVSASVAQISTTVTTSAESAQKARERAEATRDKARNNLDLVNSAVQVMKEIENSSMEVQEFVGVIESIAFQTNLLALNAGVEAARAGDAGRGFAVVASEVRALAQRSSEASSDIKRLIASSGSQVRQGVDVVNRTGTALQDVMEAILEIAESITGVADGARDQATSLSEIHSAISELDRLTQHNAAMVEETSAATQALMEDASDLAGTVGAFSGVSGGTTGSTMRGAA
ncbi:methyl-accepting chemotaxis protein [Amaricoccus macauensis]|uniref:methyl-accepting chemotaxis protein n=1 Tax=Amaricoccus macauensis TaxID=57001 RepID=UPI003C7A3F79